MVEVFRGTQLHDNVFSQRRIIMRKKIICLLTAGLITSILFPTHEKVLAFERINGSVTIKNQVINDNITGLGVNLSFSDYEYIDFSVEPGYEWGSLHSQHIPYPDDQEGWDDFFELIDFLNPQFVRMQVGMTQWEPINDDNDPQNMNLDSGFIFSPNFRAQNPNQHKVKENADIYMQSMYKILDYFEQKNTFVLLANWNLASANFSSEGLWISGANDNNQFGYPYDIEEFTESLTAIVYHLKVDKSYNCVQGISIWNEPENYKTGSFFHGYQGEESYYEILAKIYRSLDAQLKKCNARNDISIFAIDGSVEYNNFGDGGSRQTEKLLELCGDVIDYISLHTYETSLNYENNLKTQGTIEDGLINRLVKHVYNQIDEYAETTATEPKKFVSGEFGSFEYTGNDSGERLFVQRLHSVEAFMAMMNNRMKAAATWDLNANTHTAWRLLTFARNTKIPGKWTEYKRFVPEPIYYYPLALAGKYIKQGSDVLKTEVCSLEDENGVRRVSSLAVKKGINTTLLLVNDSFSDAEVRLYGLSGSYFRGMVNEKAYHKITNEGSIEISDGRVVHLTPRSITVFTTYGEIDEKPNSIYTEKVIKYPEAADTLQRLGLLPPNLNPEEKLTKSSLKALFEETQMLSSSNLPHGANPVSVKDIARLYLSTLGYECHDVINQAFKIGVLDGSFDPGDSDIQANIDILSQIAFNTLLCTDSTNNLQIYKFADENDILSLENSIINYRLKLHNEKTAYGRFIDNCNSEGLEMAAFNSGDFTKSLEAQWEDTVYTGGSYITYVIPHGSDTAKFVGYSEYDNTDWVFSASVDNINFSPIETFRKVYEKQNARYKYIYNLIDIPMDSKYIKIEFPPYSGQSMGSFEIYKQKIYINDDCGTEYSPFVDSMWAGGFGVWRADNEVAVQWGDLGAILPVNGFHQNNLPWISYRLNPAINMARVVGYIASDASNKDWEFYGSNDNLSWNRLNKLKTTRSPGNFYKIDYTLFFEGYEYVKIVFPIVDYTVDHDGWTTRLGNVEFSGAEVFPGETVACDYEIISGATYELSDQAAFISLRAYQHNKNERFKFFKSTDGLIWQEAAYSLDLLYRHFYNVNLEGFRYFKAEFSNGNYVDYVSHKMAVTKEFDFKSVKAHSMMTDSSNLAVSLKNNSAATLLCTAVAAAYNDNKLVALTTERIKMLAGETINFPFALPDENITEIKLFLLDDLGNMKPLISSQDVK